MKLVLQIDEKTSSERDKHMPEAMLLGSKCVTCSRVRFHDPNEKPLSHPVFLIVPLSFKAGGSSSGGLVCGKLVPSEALGQGSWLDTAPMWILSVLTCNASLQTQDKDFDDLEERFQWVSLCVTELKNNVAAYLDNLEVRTLWSPKG